VLYAASDASLSARSLHLPAAVVVAAAHHVLSQLVSFRIVLFLLLRLCLCTLVASSPRSARCHPTLRLKASESA
jgi:Flp pilus assembly protein protease CpaA